MRSVHVVSQKRDGRATMRPRSASTRFAGLIAAIALAQGGCLSDDSSASEPEQDPSTPTATGASNASTATEELQPEATCTTTVTPESQLLITNLAVVNDPVRTRWTGSLTNAADGAWHFGRLMTQMAGANDPAAFVRSWLAQWERDFTVNGQVVKARTNIRSLVLASWPKTSTGALDLTKAPMRLLAIVNRFDLRSPGNAGETRLVYGLTGPNEAFFPFTFILEYRVPVSGSAQLTAWSHLWRDLAAAPLGSASYRAKLQAITDRVTKRDAAPGAINGSAIAQVRTNENTLNALWELREFHLTSAGQLRMVSPALTPAGTVNNTQVLTDFLTQNQAAIRAQTHTVPATFAGQPFAGGSSLNFQSPWMKNGFSDATVRHRFALNTCDGCHGVETRTIFLHIAPRRADLASELSGFLTGVTVSDPVTGQTRTFNELAKRARIFKAFLCANP
jgi:hypothetical protein